MTVLIIGVALAVAFEAALGYARGLHPALRDQQDRYPALHHDLPQADLAAGGLLRAQPGGRHLSKHMQQDQRIREFLSGRLLLTVLDATALFVFVPILMLLQRRA